jgi:hypothetical protein
MIRSNAAEQRKRLRRRRRLEDAAQEAVRSVHKEEIVTRAAMGYWLATLIETPVRSHDFSAPSGITFLT